MDLFQQKRGFDLLYNLFVRGQTDVLRIPYTPSKTAVLAAADEYFPRATPESCGVKSAHLLAFLTALEQDRHVNLHSLTVWRDGAVICEASAHPYDRRMPHVTHSLCKSIVGLAIGLLHGEGKIDLDEPAYRYLDPKALPARLSGRMRAVTVRHLLTMSSGVTFQETGAATDTDWVRAFFSSDVRFEPGSDFAYNSMNTYVLSALVKAIVGEGLCDYLRPRLFEPLHIRNYFWETCPLGIEKGGWGLYIAQEDVLKLALLCLDRGSFAGRQIISPDWIDAACHPQKITPPDTGAYHYGYQMWCAREGENFLFNGMLGQNAWVCPQNRMIVILNAGNTEFFQKSSMLTLVDTYFGTAYHPAHSPLPRNPRALRALRQREERFFRDRAWIRLLPERTGLSRLLACLRRLPPHPLPQQARQMDGRSFLLQQNNSGILPIFVRLQQNNHTKGLRRVNFYVLGDRFFAAFDEGGAASLRVEFGFYDYRPGLLSLGGEVYRLACAASFTVDEERRPVLLLHMVFPELAHERRIKLYYEEQPASLHLCERPGKEVLSSLLPDLNQEAKGLAGLLLSRLNVDYFMIKTYEKFEPVLYTVEAEDTDTPSIAPPPLLKK